MRADGRYDVKFQCIYFTKYQQLPFTLASLYARLGEVKVFKQQLLSTDNFYMEVQKQHLFSTQIRVFLQKRRMVLYLMVEHHQAIRPKAKTKKTLEATALKQPTTSVSTNNCLNGDLHPLKSRAEATQVIQTARQKLRSSRPHPTAKHRCVHRISYASL